LREDQEAEVLAERARAVHARAYLHEQEVPRGQLVLPEEAARLVAQVRFAHRCQGGGAERTEPRARELRPARERPLVAPAEELQPEAEVRLVSRVVPKLEDRAVVDVELVVVSRVDLPA